MSRRWTTSVQARREFKLTDFGEMSAPSDDLMNRIGGGIGEGLGEARGAKARKGMLEKFGGSEGSEAGCGGGAQVAVAASGT